MQVSDLFIRRPVFAVVVSLLLMVGGLSSLISMPVREYPSVDKPVVSVSTIYRGAANEVIENRITEVIEVGGRGHRGHRPDLVAEPGRALVGQYPVQCLAQSGRCGLRRARRRLAHRGPPAGRCRQPRRAQGGRQRVRHHVDRREFELPRRHGAERLPEACLCGSPLHGGRRRQRVPGGRAPLRHAPVGRPRGPRGPRPDGPGPRDGDQAAERGAAGGPRGIQPARVHRQDRFPPLDPEGFRAGDRVQHERVPGSPRRGRPGRGRPGGQPLRVLRERQDRDRPRHRAAIHGQYPRGGRQRPGRAGAAQALACPRAPRRKSPTTRASSSEPPSTGCSTPWSRASAW